jgi:hypothetical protein
VSVLSLERTTIMPLPLHDPAEQIATLRLAALPNAVSSARRVVQQQLPRWWLDELVDDVALVVSELTSNSVKATGPLTVMESYADLYDAFLATLMLRLRLTSTDLYVEVWDASDEPPVMADPAMFDEGGRGLIVVAEYSDEWGYYPSQIGGKVTWCRIQIKLREMQHPPSAAVQRDSAGHFRIADPHMRRALDALAELGDEQLRRQGHTSDRLEAPDAVAAGEWRPDVHEQQGVRFEARTISTAIPMDISAADRTGIPSRARGLPIRNPTI